MELLAALHRAGHTVVIITHTMWVAAEYATRIVVMRAGQIVCDGPTRDVFGAEELLTAGLLGPPIVQLGHRLGVDALTVDEMVNALAADEHCR